jgi:hypothetical protein
MALLKGFKKGASVYSPYKILITRIEVFRTVVIKSKVYLDNSVSNGQQVPEFHRLSMPPSSRYRYYYTLYCISEGLILQEAKYHS